MAMDPFVSLVIIAVLALLAPLLAKLIRIPIVVGEILFGIAIGVVNIVIQNVYGLTIVVFSEPINLLATMGFVFLMFIGGLEINFVPLEDRERTPSFIGIGIMMFVVTFLIAVPFSVALGLGIYMAIILSTTSVAVIVPVLRELNLSKTPIGQTILISSHVADIATMFILTFIAVLISGDGSTIVLSSGKLLDVLMIPVIFVIFYVIYKFSGWLMWHRPDLVDRLFKQDDPSEFGVRATLGLILIFVALSHFVGIEVVLGAFLVGIMMSLLFRDIGVLERKLTGIGFGFFIPIFFIQVGTTFDLTTFLNYQILLLLPILVGVAIAVKVIPAILFLRDFDIRKRLSIGILLSSHLTLVIAAISIGRELRILTPELQSTLLFFVIVTSILNPIVGRKLLREHGAGTTGQGN